jgi:hypothetical protein
MRITKIYKARDEDTDAYVVDFEQDDGAQGSAIFVADGDLRGTGGEQMIERCTGKVIQYLRNNNRHGEGVQVIYPDRAARNLARFDLSLLPGWANWTAQEASDYIENNTTDLASAKVVLKAMAKAIIHLRDMHK